jgi:hypothetical protein
LPAKTNRTAEFSIPHPSRVPRQTRNRATVGQNNGRPFGLSVDLLGEKARGVLCNSREFLGCGLRPEIVAIEDKLKTRGLESRSLSVSIEAAPEQRRPQPIFGVVNFVIADTEVR